MQSEVTLRLSERCAVEASLPPAALPGLGILREKPLRMQCEAMMLGYEAPGL